MPRPSETQFHAAIQAAEQRQAVQEQPFVSGAPGLGPLIVALRNAWNWMSTKWYVRPLVAQQNEFNTQVVTALREAQAQMIEQNAYLEAAQTEIAALKVALATEISVLRAALATAEDSARRERDLLRAQLRAAEQHLLTTEHQASELRRRLGQLEQDTARSDTQHSALSTQHSGPLRLAYFSPLSPLKSGIAAYSESLLPTLASQAEVDLFIGDWTPTAPEIAALPHYSYRDYPSRRRSQGYDATIYQMGNHPVHNYIYDTLLQYPGIMVVHDLFLHHFLGERTLVQGKGDEYVWEMGYAAGPAAMQTARSVVAGERPAPAYDLPLIERALDASLGVVCHSQYARTQLANRRPHHPLAVVGQPIQPLAQHTPRPNAVNRPLTVITAAFLSPEKGLAQALEGFARFRQVYPLARYVLVGEQAAWFDLDAYIAQLGLTDTVEVSGYAPTLDDFDRALAEADICLSLRYPTAGETSASLLRALGVGLPAIVTDIGWFSEVPDAVCLKTPAPPTAEAVEAALLTLAQDADRRAQMSQAAAQWVADTHSPQASAHGYVAFIESLRS